MVKNIPPVNIVLFIVMTGIIIAGAVGLLKFIKSHDDPDNNYIETTYNDALSKYYTDSLSKTPLAELGKIEVHIYDSIGNMRQSFVLCSISTTRERYRVNEVKKIVLNTLFAIFPYELWRGEFKYRVAYTNSLKVKVMPLHPKQLELETEWPD